jgi:hypothetical protein
MKKIWKIIIIAELIILLIFLFSYAIYESKYTPEDNYSAIRQPVIAPVNDSCYNVTFNFVEDPNLTN